MREVQARITSAEFTEWVAYWLVNAEQESGRHTKDGKDARCGSGDPKEMKAILKTWLAMNKVSTTKETTNG